MASKGERTRQALLDAAIARFGRDGYRATSVAEIARDARLSGTAAYAYFPNKEALFVAAVDEDTAGVMAEGFGGLLEQVTGEFRDEDMLALVEGMARHPLAHRVLAGLEPEFTVRLAGIPALEQLRKATAERIRAGQLAGVVRADLDADQVAGGIVTILLSLLMSTIQIGTGLVATLGPQVRAVFDAALRPPPSTDRR
jgi:AcrR family transcriptional regulator